MGQSYYQVQCCSTSSDPIKLRGLDQLERLQSSIHFSINAVSSTPSLSLKSQRVSRKERFGNSFGVILKVLALGPMNCSLLWRVT